MQLSGHLIDLLFVQNYLIKYAHNGLIGNLGIFGNHNVILKARDLKFCTFWALAMLFNISPFHHIRDDSFLIIHLLKFIQEDI